MDRMYKAFFNLAKETCPLFHAPLEHFDYKRFLEQTACDTPIQWGRGMRVLIISDRCPGRACGLLEYLKAVSDISDIALLHDLPSAHEAIEGGAPDILIFVGYQHKKDNYKARHTLLKKNPSALVVMFAHLDDLIESECLYNNIPHSFSSWEPLAKFVEYLMKIQRSGTRKNPAEAG